MTWDSVCFGPLATCNVDWTAIGAVASFVAVAAALYIASRRDNIRRESEERVRQAFVGYIGVRLADIGSQLISLFEGERKGHAAGAGYRKRAVKEWLGEYAKIDQSIVLEASSFIDRETAAHIGELEGLTRRLMDEGAQAASLTELSFPGGRMEEAMYTSWQIVCLVALISCNLGIYQGRYSADIWNFVDKAMRLYPEEMRGALKTFPGAADAVAKILNFDLPNPIGKVRNEIKTDTHK